MERPDPRYSTGIEEREKGVKGSGAQAENEGGAKKVSDKCIQQ
jgi:hypothetical protein